MGVDVNGRYPAFLEMLFNYAAMHIMTQIHCSYERGWKMEQYISGAKGKGRLDLYDSNNNQYYEVKSKGAYNNGLHNSQMAKYDSGIVKSSGLIPTRGTKDLSGSFICGIYDVKYYTAEPGVIVYEHKVNEERVAISVAVGICMVLSIAAPEIGIPLIRAIGTFA